MTTYRVAVLVGSLRKASWTRKVAVAMTDLAPSGFAFDFIEIGDLPAYNEDLENDAQRPPAWARMRGAVRPADGLLFFTPEYNRGVPGLLKNAIDVGSRPYGQAVWSGKPAAIVSVSPGAIGGVNANLSLRTPMVFLDVPTMQQPEAYVGNVARLFDDAGRLASEDTRKFFTTVIEGYARWVRTLLPR